MDEPYGSRLAGWRREILRYVHRLTGDGAVAPFTAPGADLSWSYARGTWRFAAGYSVLARRGSLTGSSSETQHLAGAAAEWTIDRAARSVRITPYARVVNGLSRRDALFYFDDHASAAEPRPLAALPALPVLGLRIAF